MNISRPISSLLAALWLVGCHKNPPIDPNSQSKLVFGSPEWNKAAAEDIRVHITSVVQLPGKALTWEDNLDRISDEDWRVWNFFLPVRAESFDTKLALNLKAHHLYRLHGIPEQVATEIQRGTKYFDRFEVWRKREDKDPIAVGYQGNDRYLIARWGMEKLVPFETIKESMPLVLAWKYGIDALGALAGLAGLGFLVWNLLA